MFRSRVLLGSVGLLLTSAVGGSAAQRAPNAAPAVAAIARALTSGGTLTDAASPRVAVESDTSQLEALRAAVHEALRARAEADAPR
jgi:hypothetical protein